MRGGRRVYGPVPSRRLGLSLGVDLVERKVCTYDCGYCQIGVASERSCERRDPFPPEQVLRDVRDALASGPQPDVITLAGSGEPTLYRSLGAVVAGLRSLTAIPLALITNGSLLHLSEVAEVARELDILVPSLDAGDPRTFERINRPHADVSFHAMVDGLQRLSASYSGSLRLEVMLVQGVNDSIEQITAIAALAADVHAAWIEVNTPVRPPGMGDCHPPEPQRLLDALQLLGPRARLVGPFAGASAGAAHIELRQAVVETLARRPCTLEDLRQSLGRSEHAVLKVLAAGLAAGTLAARTSGHETYYEPTPTERREGGADADAEAD